MRVVMMFTWISMVLLYSNLFRISVTGECFLEQKTSLLQIRSSLTYDSSSSTKLVKWDERVECCEWPGVSCNDAGYITSLDLSFEPINGGFNVSLLLKLPSLSVIKLDQVIFSAPFPDLFGDLRNLSVLSLENCNFSGAIPASIIKLTDLVELSLGGNHFSGWIPPFNLFKNLTKIDLSDNDFTGEIPFFSHWDNLHNLEYLSLAGNSFSGSIPESLFFLPSLQTLFLSGNKFSGHINELRNVTSPLELLYLSSNKLEGSIPSFFFQLQTLSSLDLSSNKFSGQVLDNLQNVTTSQLQGLDLSCNNLEGPIPSFFFRLPKLLFLTLSSNRFKGTLHLTKFRHPENIDTLDISHNSLVVETSISAEELPRLPQFRILSLASCNLQKIPNFVKNQSQLETLDLSSNTISGEIPGWIWEMGIPNLNISHNLLVSIQEPKVKGWFSYLDLHSNMISGQIPPLPRTAFYLDLSNNNFSVIPLDIGDQLPTVLFFSIANNRVSGKISTSWCRAPFLEVLDLSNNALHGTIPSCLLQNNTNLAVMNLKGNHLSGEMPPQVFLQTCSLETLDLSQNLLEGQLPPSLVNCTKLTVLNVGNNRISDTFPCWLNQLSNLHILVLRSNHFHGTISCPRQLSWPSLQVIDLASNSFSGTIPADLFLELIAIVADKNEAKSKLDYLHFAYPENNIYYQDSVSVSLKGQSYTIEKILSIFTSIDFSSNQFEGRIPETIGELKQLYLLNISHNALTGNIPPSLEKLKALEALDLSFNNLAGNIPDQLQSLTFLSFLNLSYNDLTGRIPQGNQFNTFCADSFIGNKGLHGLQLNVSCTDIKKPAFPVPKLEEEEEESAYHGDIYASVALGFAVGLGGLFWSLLLSEKWRLYYNQKIDGILLKVFFHRGQGRRNNHC